MQSPAARLTLPYEFMRREAKFLRGSMCRSSAGREGEEEGRREFMFFFFFFAAAAALLGPADEGLRAGIPQPVRQPAETPTEAGWRRGRRRASSWGHPRRRRCRPIPSRVVLRHGDALLRVSTDYSR